MAGVSFEGYTPLEKPFKKGYGYCERMLKGGKACLDYTPNQYKRKGRERIGWNPLMPIYLCDDCAGHRIPYSIEEANGIADKIKVDYLAGINLQYAPYKRIPKTTEAKIKSIKIKKRKAKRILKYAS